MIDHDKIRLKHMLDSAEAALGFIKKKNRKHLDTDRLLHSGIVRELEILGEAAVAISQKTKDTFNDIPWKQIIGMRNRLIHAYFDVDNDIIWNTVHEELPKLVKQLKKIQKEVASARRKRK